MATPSENSKPDWDYVKASLSERVRQVRVDLFGENGGPMLSDALRVPFRAWQDYESGETIPAQVMLRFLALTDANPRWLLTGDGPRYLVKDEPDEGDALNPGSGSDIG